MSFDYETLRETIAKHGPVVRIVITKTEGSSPRDVGASMLVWHGGQTGTIGGGALEWQAATRAQDLLKTGKQQLERLALGPSMGQCCGGAVTLLSEVFSAQDADNIKDTAMFARRVEGSTEMPAAIRRLLDTKHDPDALPSLSMINGWIIEAISPAPIPIWIYGAGHVGRALVNVITARSDFVITWIDVAQDRFPDNVPDGVIALPAKEPQRLLAHAPLNAHHLILTYSHALDLELCHAALSHDFASLGLIGSATKWARFRSRLAALGHTPADINRITCPIGDPSLGKRPEAIAVGVAYALLQHINQTKTANREPRHDKKSRQGKGRAVNT